MNGERVRKNAFARGRLLKQKTCERLGFSVSQEPSDDVAAIDIEDDVQVKVRPFLPSQKLGKVSGAEEFHLRALLEPYVNLSIHTAPIIQPLPGMLSNVQRDWAADVINVSPI